MLLAIDGDDVQGRGFKAVMDQLRYDRRVSFCLGLGWSFQNV